ncbi:MAG: hypothetical protein ACLRSW_17095 [Christensenellaceae bacterium]
MQNDDPLKLVVDFKTRISPYRAEDYLKWHDIFIEMNDGRYLVFMLSPYYNVKELRAGGSAFPHREKRSLKDTYRAAPLRRAASARSPICRR